MSDRWLTYKNQHYPALQATGNAARFARAFAAELCVGEGLDIGYGKEEWKLGGAIGVDPVHNIHYEAMFLPTGPYDYIFSSHCLEHLPDWVAALDYWSTRLKTDGLLFLYLPHPDQHYWRPWNNRKHLHYLHPNMMRQYFVDRPDMWKNAFVTNGYDLNHSFYVIAEKV